MAITPKQEQVIININNRVNKILLNDGGDQELLEDLYNIMNIGLQEIIQKSNRKDLDLLCVKYKGFYRVMKLMEKLATGIAAGSIQVP